jgi:uncharacterized damage-inducible protein DinB
VIEAVLRAFATHERINQYLIQHLTDDAWEAKPPDGKGRTIRAIAAHMHNVRLMWLKMIRKGADLPAQLDKGACTRAEALKAFDESYTALEDVLRNSLPANKVKGFTPDAVSFFAYLISHDSHHRGQIASLARRLGHPLPKPVEYGMWEWGTRSREVKTAGA